MPHKPLFVLIDLIDALYAEITHWPGSYNQLLLAGSLDYCRSALASPRAAEQTTHEAIRTIDAYMTSCTREYQTYNAARSTLRTASLKNLESQFDKVQSICAQHGLYPQLENLPIAVE